MNQSLDDAVELASIQYFSIDVVSVEVPDASVDAFAAVLGALGGSPRCLLKQFSVVCPHCRQRQHFWKSFSFLSSLISVSSSLLSLFGLLPPLPALPPLPPFLQRAELLERAHSLT